MEIQQAMFCRDIYHLEKISSFNNSCLRKINQHSNLPPPIATLQEHANLIPRIIAAHWVGLPSGGEDRVWLLNLRCSDSLYCVYLPFIVVWEEAWPLGTAPLCSHIRLDPKTTPSFGFWKPGFGF
jgi:hypothetical protein